MLSVCYFYRPLSDLPQAPAAETISQDSFQSKYLAPLLGKQANVIVAFLQDKVLKLQVQSKIGGGGGGGVASCLSNKKRKKHCPVSHCVFDAFDRADMDRHHLHIKLQWHWLICITLHRALNTLHHAFSFTQKKRHNDTYSKHWCTTSFFQTLPWLISPKVS